MRLTRVVLDSLALRYASVVSAGSSGSPAPRCRESTSSAAAARTSYLNQATADASGRPVLAGPAEATATGNLLVQAIASGRLASIEEGRRLVFESARPRRFEPRVSPAWAEAAERYREIEGRYTDRP